MDMLGLLAIHEQLGTSRIAIGDVPAKTREVVAAVAEVYDAAGVVFGFDGFALVVGRPSIFAIDAEGRLHDVSGPALAFHNGARLYYWHDVLVPADVVERPERLTSDQIRGETNAEIRRVMIERMGAEGFVREMGAVKVHEDATGVLWRVEISPAIRVKELLARGGYAGLSEDERKAIEALPEQAGVIQPGETWQAVEVINSTPEPDDTRRRYFLAVPPTVQTAREAVAWTFGMTAEQYRPGVEK